MTFDPLSPEYIAKRKAEPEPDQITHIIDSIRNEVFPGAKQAVRYLERLSAYYSGSDAGEALPDLLYCARNLVAGLEIQVESAKRLKSQRYPRKRKDG